MKILLHICCAPCAVYPLQVLEDEGSKVFGFFYNPNISPPTEYLRRAHEAGRLCKRLGVGFMAGDYEARRWSQRMQGRERDHEGGAHCSVCFRIRLAKTAAVAEKRDFDYFATTLTVSPHKNARAINMIGEKVAHDLRIEFYPADFKKKNGFQKSCQLLACYSS